MGPIDTFPTTIPKSEALVPYLPGMVSVNLVIMGIHSCERLLVYRSNCRMVVDHSSWA